MQMKRWAAAFLVICLLLLSACAAKKQPYPPETQTPATTDTQSKLLSEELPEPEETPEPETSDASDEETEPVEPEPDGEQPGDDSTDGPPEPQEPPADESEDGETNDQTDDSLNPPGETNQPSGGAVILPASPSNQYGESAENSGNENTGNENSGNENTGNENSGNENTGNENSGNENTGNENSGNENTGNENSGNENSGNENSGNENSGNENSGNENSGNENTGNENLGNENTGNENPGNENSENEKPEKSGTGWLIAFLAAALVAAAEGVYIWLRGRRSKKRRRPQPQSDPVSTTLLPRTASLPQTAVRTGPVSRVAVGKVHAQGARESQQDSFSVSSDSLQPDGILAVVADGMGGLADGDRVSQTIVSAVMHTFVSGGSAAPRLPELLAKAKYAVDQLLGPDGLRRSGSTIVMGLIRDGMFDYLSVGDSRICLYRDGELQQLNRSHSYSHELSIEAINGEKTFEEIRKDRRAECLTSYVGMGELKYVDIPAAPIKVHPGDVFILMSDGVFNALKDQELSAALEQNAERAAEMIDQWIQEKHYRNQDNYTAVILQCCADAAE